MEDVRDDSGGYNRWWRTMFHVVERKKQLVRDDVTIGGGRCNGW
jgi:hypothetical protein